MKDKPIEIVIIEDEEDILELLEYHLSKQGYAVTGFLSTQKVEQFLEEEDISLLIVDRNLPNIEGSDFVLYLRDKGYDIPVIFLTAKDRDIDIDEGFQKGADDYITKPFRIKEVLLRIEAILKRSGARKQERLKYRDILLNKERRTITIQDKIIDLTNLEYNLMYLFIKNANQPLNRETLRECWGIDKDNAHEKTINVAINRLRKKIDPDGSKEYITPVWGIGYKLR
ncbi:MAG: response regulator transcription factor [Epsilonproteobacteria bacterium]|nr:response regulator transcription factor [Campylobacterota bacterium]